MQLRGMLLAAAVVGLPFMTQAHAQTQAQPVSGLYVAGGVGLNFMQQESVKPTITVGGASASGSGELQSGVGPAAVLSLGWGFGNGVRAEVEGNWSNNKFNGFSGCGLCNIASFTAGGWEQKYGVMVNGYYDFTMLSSWIVPFLGAGVGYEAVNWQGANAYMTAPVGNLLGVRATNSTKGSFAYQAMVGAAFPVSAVPGLAVTAEYRFMGLAGDRTYSGSWSVLGTTVGSSSVKSNNDYNHAILIGLRYNFGVAPPPPAPAPMAAPAPAPARSYLVFFDWDKATLTARAQQIIKEAADNSTKVQYTRIEVNGYTDTSGTPQYNQGLSVRRAQAVAAELVKDGVPKTAIAIQGFGETHLLVPTGAGVREPQNRRVEIIIR